MEVQKLIYNYIISHGISIKFIADRTDISYEMLRRSFHCQRRMTADELVLILEVLDVNLEDIKK